VRSFATPLIIRATLDKTDSWGSCSNHYIKLSTEPWEGGGHSRKEPGVVTFGWNYCDSRYIWGQMDYAKTYCAKERMYDIEITVDGSKVTWSDADGACDELVLKDAIGSSSERLYVYVGGDADIYYGSEYSPAAWHSVEICRWSLMTVSPTALPTASPSLVSPVPKRRAEAEASLVVAVAVGLSFAVIACALFIGIRRKLRKSRNRSPAFAEVQAPSAAARLRLEAEPEQLELAGTGLEPEPE